MQRRFSELRRIFERRPKDGGDHSGAAAASAPTIQSPEVPPQPQPAVEPHVAVPAADVVVVQEQQHDVQPVLPAAAEEAPAAAELPAEHPAAADQARAAAAEPPAEHPAVAPPPSHNVGGVLVSALPVLSPAPSATPASPLPTLSMISLNLLADCNLTNSLKHADDYRYQHAHTDAPWAVRLPKLQALFSRHILQGEVDVLCLQEVDYYLFHADLRPFLLGLGFAAHHQWDEDMKKKKRQEPNHPFGVAVCFREAKFKETFRESRSRTMMIGLQEKTPDAAAAVRSASAADWFVVNCHLEADAEKNDKRMAQLSSTLFNLSVHGKINPRIARVVVAGDFNSVPEDQPFQWLLGAAAAVVNDIQPHAFRFQDAYERAGEQTRRAATYADPHAAERVDHVAFTADTCEVLDVLLVPELEAATTRKFGIFYGDYPSDHYAVGCVVRALPLIAAHGDEPEAEEKEDGGGELTPGQLRVLEFLERGAPKRQGKGKPSPAEVQAMKAHTASMHAFSSHLSKAQKQWVSKWRKNYKPAEEASVHKRAMRSMSLTLTLEQQQQQQRGGGGGDMFAGMGALFGEDGGGVEESAPQQPAGVGLPPLPPAAAASGGGGAPARVLGKRRQTLFTTSTKW